MTKVKVSMDGLRRNLTGDVEALGEHLKSILDELSECEKDEVIELFDQVACGINSLNCIHDPDNVDDFNELNNLEVTHLGNYE